MSAVNLSDMRVAVLRGGKSAEREVSLDSGQTVLDALSGQGASAYAVDTADSDWLAQLDGADFAFIALHGVGGEDGTIQGALQLHGIPYSGTGVLGSALALDKQRSKELWQGIGLSTARFETLRADTDWQGVIDRLGRVFVKPAREGSSIGMTSAATAAELQASFNNASAYAGDVIAEQFIDGPEYTVGILGGKALPSICMETDNEFYDYEAKYLSDDTRYLLPSGLSAEQEREVADLALRAFASLDCAVWGRVDTMRGADGRFYVLEVNTVPGMTSHSLVPMAAAATGLEIGALVAEIVRLSLGVKR